MDVLGHAAKEFLRTNIGNGATVAEALSFGHASVLRFVDILTSKDLARIEEIEKEGIIAGKFCALRKHMWLRYTPAVVHLDVQRRSAFELHREL